MLTRQAQRYQQIVQRIEDLARAQIRDPVCIRDLCRSVAVSQRMLRSAFHEVHGVAPYRYIRTLRMMEARKGLLSPASTDATVTQIATDCGFLELGRFSVEYREIFGESPSATLRRACMTRDHQPAAHAPSDRPQRIRAKFDLHYARA
jgi:transcriptional regulator GlxA family with amidase domain